MKLKRILAVLVVVAMCLALFPSFAFAEGEKVSVLSAGGTVTNYATLEEAMTNAESGATITLLDDVTTSGQITISGKTITLDLDGHVLKYGGTTQGCVLRLESGANLTLKDSNTKGLSHKFNTTSTPWVLAADNATGDNIKPIYGGVLIGDNGKYGGGVYVNDSTFTMESGTIAGCKAQKSCGGVYVSKYSGKAKFDMKGGAILGCTATYNGGGVYLQNSSNNVSDCQFNMSGGEISYCSTSSSSSYGGGVYISDSTFNMTGGEISNCTSANVGGGVYAESYYTKISIQDGNISNCTAKNGGSGIYKDGVGTLKISGGTIDGETNIRNFKNVILSGGTFGKVTVADIDDKKCYSVLKDGYAFTSKNDSSVVSGDVLTVSDVTVAEHTKCQFENSGKCACGRPCKHSSFDNSGKCNVCGMSAARIKIGETYYLDLQTAVNEATNGDTITLINNVSTASTVKIQKDKNITLDLNGHILKYQNSETSGSLIQIDPRGTLTLKDSNTDNLTHKFNTASTPWVLADDNAEGNNIKTINGGVLIGDNSDYGGGVYVYGTFYMESGTIVGCKANFNGGGVYVSGTFDMNGGAILGCTASNYGGSVCIDNNNKGKFIFRNGTISNCDSSSGASVYNGYITLVYGNNTISENNISNDGNKIVFLKDNNDIYATEYVKSGTVPVEPDVAPTSNGAALDYWYYIDDTQENTAFAWNNAISTNYTLYGMYQSAKITTHPTAVTGLVYNNSPHALITQGTAEHGTMMYRIGTTGEYTTQIPTATDMGEYTVYYYAKGDKDYLDSPVQSVNVRIAAKDITGAVVGSFEQMTYNGTPQTPKATVTIDGLTVTGKWGDVTNVGDTSTFTANGNFTGTIENVNVGMKNKDMSAGVSASGYSGVYDNAEHTISVTLSKDAEGATIMYGTTEGKYNLTDAPVYKDSGTYKVYYQVTKATYEPVAGSKTVEISAKDITNAVVGSFEQITYNGTPQTPNAEVTIDGLTVTGKWSDVTNVGDTSTFTANGNFTGTIENVNVGMKNKDMSAGVSASGYSGVYDNGNHTISVTLSKDAEGATIMYGTTEGKYNLTDAPVYKDKGTYTVYYQVTKANYETVAGSKTVEISAKDITNAVVGSFEQMTYNGTPQTPKATVTIDGLTVTGKWSDVTNVGDTSTFTANGNFTGTIENVNVGMKNKDMSAGVSASGYSGVYDNAEHTISVTLSKDAEGATIMYGTTEGKYNLTDAPVYKDKGTYTVYYQVTKATYEPVAGSKTVVISAKDITDAEITLGDSLKYNGEEQTQTITSVTVDGLTVTYDVSGNVQKDAGEYTLTVTGNGNFTGSVAKAWSISASVEQTPNIQIDYANEVLKGFENANYTIDGSNVTLTDGKLAIADYIGKTISIVKKGTGTNIQDSAAQEIVIPPRPTAPKADDFAVTQPSEVGGKGSISGITDTMEYSTNNGTEWTVGSGEDIGEIADGTKYLVRYKATDSSFKSESYAITVIAFNDTSTRIVLTAESVKALNADSGVLIVAGFGENGMMKKINFIDAYESELIGYENCYEIKAFLWNNLEEMIPICDNAYIKNSK